MYLPNKLYTFEQSTLAQLSPILEALQHGSLHVIDLFNATSEEIPTVNDFLEALTCLYALRAISFDEESQVISYAS